MKILTICLSTLILISLLKCGHKDYNKSNQLKHDINRLISNSAGIVAVAFEDLITGEKLFINEKIQMHAASTMKTSVMIEVFKQAHQGRFNLNDSLTVKNEFRSIVDDTPYSIDMSEDSDQLIYHYLDQKMSIRDLVYQMITASSNLATNILIELVGAKNIMKTMREIGANHIQILRGVEDSKAFQQGLNNTTDAFDLLVVMKAIALKQVVTPDACDEMIDILAKQQFRKKIPVLLPLSVRVANKTGSITEIDHDSAIIYFTDDHPYVLVVLTSGIKNHKQAEDLIAQISKLIYDSIQIHRSAKRSD